MLREPSSASTASSFSAGTIPSVRWVSSVSGIDIGEASPASIVGDFRLSLEDEGRRVLVESFPASLLSVGLPGSSSIKLQGTLAEAKGLPVGRYTLILRYRTEVIATAALDSQH